MRSVIVASARCCPGYDDLDVKLESAVVKEAPTSCIKRGRSNEVHAQQTRYRQHERIHRKARGKVLHHVSAARGGRGEQRFIHTSRNI